MSASRLRAAAALLVLFGLFTVEGFSPSLISAPRTAPISSALRGILPAGRLPPFVGAREAPRLAPRNARAPLSPLRMALEAAPDGKTVLVVGGGLGGASVCFDLAKGLRKGKDQVVLLSERPAFEFTPSNPWVATRFRKPEDIRVDLHTTMTKQGVKFVHGAAKDCDATRQVVFTADGEEISYDYLVIATGACLDLDAVPGLREHASSVCTTDHAIHAADRWDAFIEGGGTDIVVGCMQGASCFGPGYEYSLMLDNELRLKGLRDKVSLTFLTSEPYIGHLGLAGVGPSQKQLEKLLVKRGINIVPNCAVNEITKDSVSYTVFGGVRATVPCQFSMFIPAFTGIKAWTEVPDLTAPNGMVRVDEHMRSLKYDNIFAIGTAVSLPPVEVTPVPTGAPKTGYMIESMGTCAADNIRKQIEAELEGKSVHKAADETPTLSALCITDFGDTGAIALAMPQFKPRRLDVHTISPMVRLAKMAFETYFLFKVRTGDCDPYYEKWMLKLIGLERVTDDINANEQLKKASGMLPKRNSDGSTSLSTDDGIH